MKLKLFYPFFLFALLFSSCFPENLKKDADQKFGDQHFKTAISLIELYKIREGHYPNSLDSLKFLGDWDQIIFKSISYKKLDTGYQLDVTNGVFGKPVNLKYPKEFWKGLGLKKSNMKP